jgi:hypothetical protein
VDITPNLLELEKRSWPAVEVDQPLAAVESSASDELWSLGSMRSVSTTLHTDTLGSEDSSME